jgi:S1-C subfamily serine protease
MPVHELPRPRRARGGWIILAALMIAAMPALPARADERVGSILDAFEQEMLSLARRSQPYVVGVEAHLGRVDAPAEDPGGAAALAPRKSSLKKRIGSGIALDASGTILTTASIVDHAAAVYVQTPGGRSFRAVIVGLDRRTNVALLSAPEATTVPARLGESSLVTPGSRVVVVGSLPARKPLSSFGGIELDRGLIWGYSEVEMLQLNAPVYRGHIGAPVVNSEGRVVGMVCGTLDPGSNSGRGNTVAGLAGYIYEGRLIPRAGNDVSFAIPIEKAQEICAELRQHGRVDRGFLGVRVRRGEAAGPKGSGVLVEELLRGGPADRAGLHVGDSILEYAGQPVTVGDDVTFLVMATRPGSKVPLTVRRDGDTATIEITIGRAPNEYPNLPQLSGDSPENLGMSAPAPSDSPGSRRP